ncbi:hypothetical protein [uncultured Chitinophaga sp.]|jgi:hypothetical protein|uniref:hypothetical protein n=1 Tax=uncultured Chitinophaga sp. TaxID=339340 RepID=UPI002627C028|nr:hypothetical protein [uncultured Chitinophaga sp.]
MKKAKVVLTAIGIFAIVGGALAFKAKTFGQPILYIATTTTTTTPGGPLVPICSARNNLTTTAGVPNTTVYRSTLANSVCTTPFVTRTTLTVPGI